MKALGPGTVTTIDIQPDYENNIEINSELKKEDNLTIINPFINNDMTNETIKDVTQENGPVFLRFIWKKKRNK